MSAAYSALDPQADRPVLRIEAVEGWTDPEPPEAILDRVIGVVCKTWAVTREDLLGDRRPERIVAPRLALYALAKRATGENFSAVGRMLGRTHGSVMHGLKAAANRIDTDRHFAAAYRAAEVRLGITP